MDPDRAPLAATRGSEPQTGDEIPWWILEITQVRAFRSAGLYEESVTVLSLRGAWPSELWLGAVELIADKGCRLVRLSE